MRHLTRLLGLLGLVILVMIVVFVPESSGALAPPKGGVVEVTGFTRVGLDGNSGPVVVMAKGGQAAALRTALAGLVLKSTPSDCMESANPFTVSFLSRKGARPTMVAYAFDCDGPGVSVLVGHATTILKGNCSFQAAAMDVLSHARVEGTRQALPLTCPRTRN